MEYRIENIRKVVYNNKKYKMFDAYRLVGDKFSFYGRYLAPRSCSDENLTKYIDENYRK